MAVPNIFYNEFLYKNITSTSNGVLHFVYIAMPFNCKLHLGKPNTDFMKKSFSYRGASAWNDLPNNVVMATMNSP